MMNLPLCFQMHFNTDHYDSGGCLPPQLTGRRVEEEIRDQAYVRKYAPVLSVVLHSPSHLPKYPLPPK